ncbi:hypothetical protein HNQ44_003062 [Planomicrobium koreense]|uniref:Uncharacterized protein n=1 Tax=Planococcus koreensis TaxID=112331 RepID=A0A7W8FW69_9BACL|nr:hypothetical protein [Planococcus koreensis]
MASAAILLRICFKISNEVEDIEKGMRFLKNEIYTSLILNVNNRNTINLIYLSYF